MSSNDDLFIKTNKSKHHSMHINDNNDDNKPRNNDFDSNLEIIDLTSDPVDDRFEDRTELSSKINDLRLQSSINSMKCFDSYQSEPIDHATAVKLKQIVLGDSKKKFARQWLEQYFEFNDLRSPVWYGLKQHHGGPCGVLASIQAYLLREFFHSDRVSSDITDDYRHDCLCRSITDILLQLKSDNQSILIAIETNDKYLDETKSFKEDNLTEFLRIFRFNRSDRLKIENFLKLAIQSLPKSFGAITFMYSLVLTRGVQSIQNDYDQSIRSSVSLLISNTQICSQELVNLCLIGQALSNVFDNHIDYDDGLKLYGLTQRSTIGFLTIHEYFGEIKVGNNYKQPKLPIYVVLNEQHFTVMFSKVKMVNEGTQDSIEIYYYDCLLKQDDEIRLRIEKCPPECSNDDQRSSIESVIMTKWPEYRINWPQSSISFL